MTEILFEILNPDAYTVSVTAALTCLATLLLATAVDSKTLGVMFSPFMAFGALAAVWAFRQWNVTPTLYPEANTIIAAGAGIIAGFLFVTLALRVLHWVREQRVAVTNAHTERLKSGNPG